MHEPSRANVHMPRTQSASAGLLWECFGLAGRGGRGLLRAAAVCARQHWKPRFQ